MKQEHINTNLTKKRKYVYCVLLCAIMIAIFILSGQSGEASQKLSETVAESVDITQTNEYLSKSATPIFGGLSLRKYAHVLLYALLGVFLFLFVKQFQIKRSWTTIISIIGCYLYSCLDEIHQIFVTGRTAKITDTLVDALGFLPVILILSMIFFLIARKKQVMSSSLNYRHVKD